MEVYKVEIMCVVWLLITTMGLWLGGLECLTTSLGKSAILYYFEPSFSNSLIIHQVETKQTMTVTVFRLSVARFSKVPKRFRTRKAVAKSQTWWLQSCFIHICMKRGSLHTKSFRRIPSVFRYKLLCGPERFPGLSSNGPLIVINRHFYDFISPFSPGFEVPLRRCMKHSRQCLTTFPNI